MPIDDRSSFQEILTAAIDDMLASGFDSMERVDRWMRLLRTAAERTMTSPAQVDQALRDGLAAIYRRMVDRNGVLTYNVGIDRFTLEQIKPKLRAELDRRIMASADLIKLNRAESIDKTLRRFQGWATSIPAGGGVTAETKAETKATVRKSLAGLPFEQRRVVIDQGHKLVSAINEIIAADGGAIACRWRSNWRQPGYNYREDHKDRDEQVYLVRDSWAHRAGLVKKGKAGYYDEITAAGQEVFCRCYVIWLYHVRDLPEDMQTQKGRRAMVEVGMHMDATRAFARADAENVSRETVPIRFEGAPPAVVDRDGALATLSDISSDGMRLYLDRSLPRVIEIRGRWFDPVLLLWPRQYGRWREKMELTAGFLYAIRRPLSSGESQEIDRRGMIAGGAAERRAAERAGIDWTIWESWGRDAEAKIAQRTEQWLSA